MAQERILIRILSEVRLLVMELSYSRLVCAESTGPRGEATHQNFGGQRHGSHPYGDIDR